MSKSFNSALRHSLSLAALAVSAMAAPMASADTLRVCSDPDNLPFSKSEGAEKGLYIELAEKVGQRLGTPVEYVWWLSFNQRRALRNTMEGCDAYFALPADAEYRVKGLDKSIAFLNLSYALLAPKGTGSSTVQLLNEQVNQVLKSADVSSQLSNHGIDVAAGAASLLSDLLKTEMARWALVVKNARIKAD